MELEAAIGLRHRARTHRRQVRARLRLSEVHRAGPHAFNHLRQVHRLLRVGTDQLQRLDRTLREQRAQREREVGAVPHFLNRRRHELRQTLPAMVRVLGQAVPAVVGELLVRFLEPGRRLHYAAVDELRALAIAHGVERVEHFGRELRRLFEDRRDGVRRRILVTGQLAHLLHAGELVHDEQHVFQRGVIRTHGCSLETGCVLQKMRQEPRNMDRRAARGK